MNNPIPAPSQDSHRTRFIAQCHRAALTPLLLKVSARARARLQAQAFICRCLAQFHTDSEWPELHRVLPRLESALAQR